MNAWTAPRWAATPETSRSRRIDGEPLSESVMGFHGKTSLDQCTSESEKAAMIHPGHRRIRKSRQELLLTVILMAVFHSQDNCIGETNAFRLSPCSSSPNCVSSFSDSSGHRIDPFVLAGSSAETLNFLVKAVQTFPRVKIVVQQSDYLKVEFRTRLGFVDDLECLIDEEKQIVHVRSASRVGYWDFGVNRKRVEALRKTYHNLAGIP